MVLKAIFKLHTCVKQSVFQQSYNTRYSLKKQLHVFTEFLQEETKKDKSYCEISKVQYKFGNLEVYTFVNIHNYNKRGHMANNFSIFC